MTVRGIKTEARVGDPPSPQASVGNAQGIPFPTTVDMVWFEAVTSRIRLLNASTMYRFPSESSAGLRGSYKLALVAAPPSPTKPFPTTVETVFVLAVYRRTRSLQKSPIQRLPVAESTNSPEGLVSSIAVAAPSPLNPNVVVPTIV